jgi:hypothetical protein
MSPAWTLKNMARPTGWTTASLPRRRFAATLVVALRAPRIKLVTPAFGDHQINSK